MSPMPSELFHTRLSEDRVVNGDVVLQVIYFDSEVKGFEGEMNIKGYLYAIDLPVVI